MRFKMIYLARRNPSISQEDWPSAWRSHSRFIARFPSIGAAVESLLYCGRIYRPELDGDRFDPPQASRDYDGVAIVAARSREALGGTISAADRALIDADERRVFDRNTPDFSFYCREERVLGDAPGSAAVIRFLAGGPVATSEQLGACWQADHAARAVRLVYNRLVEPPPPGFPFDGIAESWFATAQDAIRSLAGSSCYAGSGSDRSVTMLTETIYQWPKA